MEMVRGADSTYMHEDDRLRLEEGAAIAAVNSSVGHPPNPKCLDFYHSSPSIPNWEALQSC